jgi:hypothetical protein
VGIVLVWKGVWETAELFPILHGFPSFLIGVLILLTSGLLVSFFVGDSIIMSGFKREKKLVEKTQGEIHSEMDILLDIKKKVDSLERSMPLKKDE